MDGESLSIAQRHSKSSINDHSLIGFAYGNAQKERDSESGYPLKASTKDNHEWAQTYVDPKTGATKTPH
jgi:hypothetical protein